MKLKTALADIYAYINADTDFVATSFTIDGVEYTGVVNAADLEEEERAEGVYLAKYYVFMNEGEVKLEVDQEIRFNGQPAKIGVSDNMSTSNNFLILIYKV